MAKSDLDLERTGHNRRPENAPPKIDPDPLLGKFDMLLFVLERIANGVEDIADLLEGEEPEPEKKP